MARSSGRKAPEVLLTGVFQASRAVLSTPAWPNKSTSLYKPAPLPNFCHWRCHDPFFPRSLSWGLLCSFSQPFTVHNPFKSFLPCSVLCLEVTLPFWFPSLATLPDPRHFSLGVLFILTLLWFPSSVSCQPLPDKSFWLICTALVTILLAQWVNFLTWYWNIDAQGAMRMEWWGSGGEEWSCAGGETGGGGGEYFSATLFFPLNWINVCSFNWNFLFKKHS